MLASLGDVIQHQAKVGTSLERRLQRGRGRKTPRGERSETVKIRLTGHHTRICRALQRPVVQTSGLYTILPPGPDPHTHTHRRAQPQRGQQRVPGSAQICVTLAQKGCEWNGSSVRLCFRHSDTIIKCIHPAKSRHCIFSWFRYTNTSTRSALNNLLTLFKHLHRGTALQRETLLHGFFLRMS